MAKRVGVLLSGCGVQDGSEIHEAVLCLLALDRHGAQAVCTAPDLHQHEVVNHLTGEATTGERRNALVESARIARGKIRRIDTIKATDLDAILVPGGFGATKNLCNYHMAHDKARPRPEVARLLKEMHVAKKPIGALCLGPVVLAAVFRDGAHLKLTIGHDAKTAEALGQMGAVHEVCAAGDICVDEANKIVSSPAYMLAAGPAELWTGIDKLVERLLQMI